MNSYLGKSKKLQALILISVLFVFSGCMPVDHEQVNTELFKNIDEFKQAKTKLRSGMTKDEVLKELNIPVEKLTSMNTEELQKAVYGNSQVQGTPEQLERFKDLLTRYEGYYLTYRDIESNGTLGFGKMKVNKKGYDLKLVLVFERNLLFKASIDGSQDVNINQDKYLWGSLIEKGTGVGL